MRHSSEHSDFNTRYTLHNDSEILWLIFEYECVIVSWKLNVDVTKSHVNKPNNKSNEKTSTILLMIHVPVHDGNISIRTFE